jgi:hypothetical protein
MLNPLEINNSQLFISEKYINSFKNRSRPGKQVNLTEQEVRGLCIKARDIFINQPILLELEAPIKICGKY